MDNNNPCLFCSREKLKSQLIEENDLSIALWDANPVSKGHVLIIPKRHIESFFELEDKELLSMFSLVKLAKRIISEEHHPDGFNIGINDGTAAGRTIHHLHIHLIPRYISDVTDPKGGVRHIIPDKGYY